MPGKQMAIDADLNSGIIDEEQARIRRAEVAAEADFYGAMDGGSKFVKGDAIAGIIITVINLVGGIIVGMLQMGMPINEAVQRFSMLTVGDGLVTQIPALLLSVSTGIVVTRASADGDLGSSAATQLFQSPTALTIAVCGALGLAIVPGMPILPFFLVGGGVLIMAVRARGKARAAVALVALPDAAPSTADSPEQILEQMRVHALEVHLAPDLVHLVGSGPDQDLLGRVRSLRRKVAFDLGIVVPPVRARDDVDLPPSTYSVLVAGVERGRGIAPAGKMLALGDDLAALPGTIVEEPVFGLPGKWSPAELRRAASTE
jgi:flagellar biosynthesis protein FlhA